MQNVLLVFGGRSYEHDISVVTASQIYARTRLENIRLIPFYISKNNKFYIYNCEKFNIRDFADFDEKRHSKNLKEVVFVSGEKGKLFFKSLFGLKEYLSVSLAIIACHGGDGENGNLVSFFNYHGIYSSSGSIDGLAVAMNKTLFKSVMKANKIPVVSGFEINKNDYQLNKDKYFLRLRSYKFPLVIKPANGGSSIGLFVAESKYDFEDKLFQAFEFDNDVLVEKFVLNAREFNIACLGDKTEIIVSEVDEPLKLNEVLSFEDKYLAGLKTNKGLKDLSMLSQKRKFPADISVEFSEKIKGYAREICSILKLSGVVRIDFLYDEDNDKIYVCEVNSVPGSLAFYFFERGKVLINDFVLKLIDVAKQNASNGSVFNVDFVTKVLN